MGTTEAAMQAVVRSLHGFHAELSLERRWRGPRSREVGAEEELHLTNDICSRMGTDQTIVQELCESRGGRPGLSVLTSLLVSVDVKNY